MRKIAVLCAFLAVPALAGPQAKLAGPVAGSVAEDRASKDDYELDTSATDTTIKAGGQGTFSLVVKPKNGKKVHPDAPFEVTFKDPKGVRPAKSKLGRSDVVDKAAKAPEVRTTLKADKAGAATLEVSVSFFLCTDAWCQRMTDRVSIPITVE